MFYQHPLIAVVFAVLAIAIILKECFKNHRFYKIRLLLSFIPLFVGVFALVFYNQILDGVKNADGNITFSALGIISLVEASNNFLFSLVNWGLLAVDIISFIIIFTCVGDSSSNASLQALLTKSYNETKLYVLLDKKDRVKEISKRFLEELNVDSSDAYGMNFFDLLSLKYRIIGCNGNDCYREDLKKFYSKYDKVAKPNTKNTFDFDLQLSDGAITNLFLSETTIFNDTKYKGRILMGDVKNEEEILSIEADLKDANKELDLIRSRFITIFEKTGEGIYFNNLSDKTMWCNDSLVSKLALNGNSMTSNDFYKYIDPADLPLYQEKIKAVEPNGEYSVSYKFKTPGGYLYVKEEGRKIVLDKTVELCGIMTPIDNVKFSKTDTILDTIESEAQMNVCYKELQDLNRVFMIVRMNLVSIPEINETYGWAIGNLALSEYIQSFKNTFVNDNMIYRLSGLEFVAFVTDYRKMELLKTKLANNESILHIRKELMNKESYTTEVYMGITYTNDDPNPKNGIKNTKEALKCALNANYMANYAFYKDIK